MQYIILNVFKKGTIPVYRTQLMIIIYTIVAFHLDCKLIDWVIQLMKIHPYGGTMQLFVPSIRN